MKEFLKHLFKQKNPSYLLVWMYILANTDSDGNFSCPRSTLMAKFNAPKQTLRRIISYGVEWFGNGSGLVLVWDTNDLNIKVDREMCGSGLVSVWFGFGSVTAKKVVKKVVKTHPKPIINNDVEEIIEYLNQKAGKKFKPNNKKSIELINARKKDGFTLSDFKSVIDTKVDKWKNTKWDDYLRPSTLFNNKFEAYLNEKRIKTSETQQKYHSAIARAENSDYSEIIRNRPKNSRTNK